jgi:hypothetical protein
VVGGWMLGLDARVRAFPSISHNGSFSLLLFFLPFFSSDRFSFFTIFFLASYWAFWHGIGMPQSITPKGEEPVYIERHGVT